MEGFLALVNKMIPEFIIEVARSKGGTRTRIRHRNGNIVFNGGQLYSRKKDALEMIRNLVKSIEKGEFAYFDKEHGITVDRIPNSEVSDDVVMDDP